MVFDCVSNSNPFLNGGKFIFKIREYAAANKVLVFKAGKGADASRRLLFIFRAVLNKLFQVPKAVPNKTNISFVMSVCMSVCPPVLPSASVKHLGYHWVDVRKI
jgi:hypothetical protein